MEYQFFQVLGLKLWRPLLTNEESVRKRMRSDEFACFDAITIHTSI